jgi:hypothetical protein
MGIFTLEESMRRQLIDSLLTVVCVLFIASSVAAQGASSGIAGVVRDTSGAVMPGVTVEASSPALIEKVRVVVSDDQGQYKFVALVPGVYTVTFTLPGFRTMKREGVELQVNFTATINAELAPGQIEETITVAGASPTVDVQNTAVRNVLSAEVLDTVPTSKGVTSYAALTVGVTALSNSPATTGAQPQDVGGSSGDVMMHMTYHGNNRQDAKIMLDGFETNFRGYNRLYVPDPHSMQETSLDLGGGTAEVQGAGVSLNFIPKSGGNVFSGDLFGTYTNEDFQDNNITDELVRRGLDPSSVNGFKNSRDFSASLGGPIKRDKVWFFAAHRRWGTTAYVAGLLYNKTPEAIQYTPDPSRPGVNDFTGRSSSARARWQATPRNGFAFTYDWQSRCDCHRDITSQTSPEAAPVFIYSPVSIATASWTFPASNKLLFQAGLMGAYQTVDKFHQSEVTADAIAIREANTNFTYRAVFGTLGPSTTKMVQPRFSMSYVTGSHAFKIGFNLIHEYYIREQTSPHNVAYVFRAGRPDSITQFATPTSDVNTVSPDLGLFAQDQWTIRRLTLNLGLRFDYLRRGSPPQELPAVQFRPTALSFDSVECSPCETDVQPRVSAAYDIFGNGKTAVKASAGRYVLGRGLGSLSNPANNIVTQVSRTWRDTNGNFVPDCNLTNPLLNGECEQIGNLAFGQPTQGTQYADDVLRNFRGYSWQYSASIQHELAPRVSAGVGFFRNSWHNQTATDNLLVAPADYDPYCLTLPPDSRLPGGGGNQLCGFADVRPLLFGRVSNLVTRASKFGEQTSVYTGVDANFTARFSNGAFVGGGTSTGRQRENSCFVVDSPEALLFCDVVPPYKTQIKLMGMYPLPWDFQVSGTFQSHPGIPISASYVAGNLEVAPTLGRSLSGNRSSVTLNNIIPPETMFEDRSTQLDVRLTRIFRFGVTRLRANLDVFNVFNASSILATNTRYGPNWLQPTVVLSARLFKLSAQLTF